MAGTVHGEEVVGRAHTLQPFNEGVVIKRPDMLVVLEHGAVVAIGVRRNKVRVSGLYVHFERGSREVDPRE